MPLDFVDVLVTEAEQVLQPVKPDDFFVSIDVVGHACLQGLLEQLLCTMSIKARCTMLSEQAKDFVGIDVGPTLRSKEVLDLDVGVLDYRSPKTPVQQA
ncbi:MAG: hypothetical protein ACJ8HQ_05625, partial [Chthoniobacterales bacterium]